MSFIFCFIKKQRAKMLSTRNTVDSLAMVAVICKAIAEKVANEKGIKSKDAMKFVIESILDSQDLLN